MKDWIKNLLTLQAADLRAKKMDFRMKEIPKEKQEIMDGLSGEEEKVAEAKEGLLDIEKEIRKLEKKVDEIKEKIRDLQSKSAMVKKNEEYKALLSEVETCKVNIGGFENKQIDFMDELEKRKKALEAAQKTFEYMSSEASENVEELEELSANLKTEIDEILNSRKALIKKIEPGVFSIYNRLIKKHGEPLSKIHNDTCGNCHLKLTPQTLNDAKKSLVSTCDTCGHLIYFADE